MSLSAGFFGKIPARGDFVRAGLPPDFQAALDAWWQEVLPASRARLGEAWPDIWMEAPVWRFALAPGVCGASPAVGLWLPSTDRAGRLFPLTIAAVATRWSELARLAPFLDAAAAIGYRTLEEDLPPDALAALIAAALASPGTPPADPLAEPPARGGLWWTDGSPEVAPATRRLPSLPEGGQFAAMLRD